MSLNSVFISNSVSHSKKKVSNPTIQPFRSRTTIHENPQSIFDFNSAFLKINATIKFKTQPKSQLKRASTEFRQTIKYQSKSLKPQKQKNNDRRIMDLKNMYKGSIRERIKRLMNSSLAEIEKKQSQLIIPMYQKSVSINNKEESYFVKKLTPRYQNHEYTRYLNANRSLNQTKRYSRYVSDNVVDQTKEKMSLSNRYHNTQQCFLLQNSAQNTQKVKIEPSSQRRQYTQYDVNEKIKPKQYLSMTGLDFRRLIKSRNKSKIERKEEKNDINAWEIRENQQDCL